MADADIDILIRAKDLASKTVRGVRGELGKLDGVGSKAARNLTKNLVRLGAVGAVSLAGGVALGARALGNLERQVNQTNAVLETTKGVSGQTADSIRAQAEALERLTTADDKAIQEGQNMLLTFTKIGKDAFPDATEAMVNMAIAMAGGDASAADFQGTAKQLGKALNDPVKGITALSRAGVSFTKEQKAQIKALVKSGDVLGAQKLILQELETEFGKAGEAAGKGFEADLRRVQDAGEDATMALARGVMPVLTRAADWLSRKLADPAVLAAISDLGDELGDLAGEALDFIETVDFKAIGAGLGVAKDAAKSIVGAFLSLPPWVQQAVVTGWGLNKLTGGALGDVVGALGSGLIKGVLGMNAGVVNLRAATVVGGGVGAGGAAGVAGKAGIGAVGKMFLVGEAIGLAAAVYEVQQAVSAESTAHGQQLQTQTQQWLAQSPTREQLVNGLAGVRQGISDIRSNPLMTLVQGEALASLEQMEADIQAQLDKSTSTVTSVEAAKAKAAADAAKAKAAQLETKRETTRGASLTAATTRTSSARNAATISGAIARNRPKVTTTVTVNVTGSAVSRSINVQESYGPGSGSAGTGHAPGTGPQI